MFVPKLPNSGCGPPLEPTLFGPPLTVRILSHVPDEFRPTSKMPVVFSLVTTGPAAGLRFSFALTVLLNPSGEVPIYNPPPGISTSPNAMAATLPGKRYGAWGG